MSRKNKTKKSPKGKGSQGFNRKNSEKFLNKNRQVPGVQETDSGLQFLVLEDGDGSNPVAANSVMVHQRISLIDGTKIDDTYQKNEPAEFTLAEALAGYREGLMLMRVGGRYKLFIPPNLAWGKRGAGKKIGPFATLIIDVRLLKIF
ncbi:MAG: peptidylprolyl isomerase [Calditrichaeota bacterium]|nr:MAG: peptidylprolyl isomerase [Calditrichota bacterium]